MFHSDASTFEMPKVIQICSLFLSHSLYVILKSSYSWQCMLTATYRYWRSYPSSLQEMRRLSCATQKQTKKNFHIVRHETLFIWSITDPHISLLSAVVFPATKSHWTLVNLLDWSGTITCCPQLTATVSESQEIKLWPKHREENNMVILCLLHGRFSMFKLGKNTYTVYMCS